MIITCQACSQDIEAPDSGDISQCVCPSCGVALSAFVPQSSSASSVKSKPVHESAIAALRFWVIISSLLTLLGISLSSYLWIRFVYPWDYGSKDPKQTIRHLYEIQTRGGRLTDESFFLSKHRTEILKTLEVVVFDEKGQFGMALIRYSTGNKVFRDSRWLRKIDGKWYLIPNLSPEYSKTLDIILEKKILTEFDESMKRWESESAERWYDGSHNKPIQ